MRASNAIGRMLPWVARPSAERWWAEARKGVPDAGEPSPEAQAALEALTSSLIHESRLHFIGRISARDDTVRMARNHLRIAALLRDRPEILETALPDPIFVVGLPRTGTTFLHQLMSQDARSRTIPYWESFDPIPPTEGPDRRAAAVDKMLKQLEGIAPDYHAIHPMAAEAAEECVALFMNELRTLQYDIQYAAPGYVRWLLAGDARVAYRGYLRQLKIIQFFRPAGERFVLKDPVHLVHLDALLEVFPNAKILFTHRDPGFSISSICSLYAYTRAIFSDEVDPLSIGQEVLGGHWPVALELGMRRRGELADSRFVDVRQADLASRPIETLRTVYEKWGWEFDGMPERAMRSFLQTREREGGSVHEHRPEGFGLSAPQIRDRLKDYVEAFDL